MAIGTPYSAAAAVQSTATSASDTITTNQTVPITDTLFILVKTRLAASYTVTSVTNSGSLAVTPVVIQATNATLQNGADVQIRVYAAVAIPSGTTFTVNYSASPTRHELGAFGVSGVADATPDAFHIGNGDGAGGVPVASTAGASPAVGDLAVGTWAHVGAGANGDSGTPTTGFTEFDDTFVSSATPFLHAYTEYRLLAAAGVATSSPTFANNSGGWLGQVIVYQPATQAILNVPPGPYLANTELGQVN